MPLITFEGIEGSGKSTQARRAAAHYRDLGRDVLLEREPGGTAAGRAIRALLLDPRLERLDPLAELLLIEADRRQHVAEVLQPALDAGRMVFCDRFNDATFAYQGGGRGLAEPVVSELDRWGAGPLRPDLTLLFDCPVAMGLERASRRDAGQSARFENEPAAFHERVRSAYRERARKEPGRFRIVDTTRPREDVFAEVLVHLDPFFA